MTKRILIALAVVLLAYGVAAAQTMGNPVDVPLTPEQQLKQGGRGSKVVRVQEAPPPPPTSPTGKVLPQAKTKEEYEAFMTAAGAAEGAEAEKLAREFEVKFPASELKSMLFQQVMLKYQRANNADKTVEMSRKALESDPDNVVALVMGATVVAERTRETDIDREERLAEVTKNAQKAIANINSGNFTVQAGATPEQLQMFKDTVLSMAYGTLGQAELTRKNPAAAEQHLRQASQTATGRQDAITWYRLALALDQQKKYAEALHAANQAVMLAGSNASLANLAKAEQERLRKLVGAAAPSPSATSSGGGGAPTAATPAGVPAAQGAAKPAGQNPPSPPR